MIKRERLCRAKLSRSFLWRVWAREGEKEGTRSGDPGVNVAEPLMRTRTTTSARTKTRPAKEEEGVRVEDRRRSCPAPAAP